MLRPAAVLILLLASSPSCAQEANDQRPAAFARPRPLVQAYASLPGQRSPDPLLDQETENPFGSGFEPRGGRAAATADDVDCMARAMTFEAHASDYNGLLAVGTVIANRAEAPGFPESWCGVVAQRGQFSSNPLGRTPEPLAYALAQRIALDIMAGLRHPALRRVYEFRTANARLPADAVRVGVIGGNVFFRR
jgi:spore germination cell wall hydrolase CwlJ-like protein